MSDYHLCFLDNIFLFGTRNNTISYVCKIMFNNNTPVPIVIDIMQIVFIFFVH